MTLLDRLADLSSTEFENLVYDCARSCGMGNLVWRTPGADGGRDIEGRVVVTDIVGEERVEKWYIECKKHARSIGWPTIWKKVAYADSPCADVFLLATNSNPSPNCETQIATWNNARRRPTIRVWRGYSFEHILATRTHIKLSYGLSEHNMLDSSDALSLARLILGIVQAANAGNTFGLDVSAALETASTLTELLEQRLSDIKNNGRFGSSHILRDPGQYPWLRTSGDYSQIEEIAFYSTFAALRYFSGASSVDTVASAIRCTYAVNGAKFSRPEYSEAFRTVLEWSRAEEAQSSDGNDISTIEFRKARHDDE